SEPRTRGAVWPKPFPADLPHGCAAGVSEIARFSCMKLLGVPGVFDYAGLLQGLALSSLLMFPSAHLYCVGVRVVSFRSSIAHPAYTPVYASLCASRLQRN